MQEDKINIKLIKKTMTEKKTRLPSLRNQKRRKVKVETEKINKLLPNIPKRDITELKELISEGAKLVYDKLQPHFPMSNIIIKFIMEAMKN